MLTAFKTLNFADQQLNRFQDNVAAVFARIVGPKGVSFLDGVAVTATLTSGSNNVLHKLGRTPLGWIVTDITAAATLYRSAASSPTSLFITASAPCSASLWVF